MIWQQETRLVDSDAENQSLDADVALQELGSDAVSFGFFTATITVWDEDEAAVAEKVKLIGRVVRSQGFVVVEETLNAVEAWLSSLPGQCYANVRQPPVSSLNLVHMLPLSAVWAGPERNAPSRRPALAGRAHLGCDPVPSGAASGRCRPYPDGRADRRRQIGAAGPDRPAVPPLSRQPGRSCSTRGARPWRRSWRRAVPSMT